MSRSIENKPVALNTVSDTVKTFAKTCPNYTIPPQTASPG